MARVRGWLPIGTLLVVLFAASAVQGGELVDKLFRRSQRIYPKPSTAYRPEPGKHPYYGEALGATYYRWGHFGAQEHPFYTQRNSFYGDHWEVGRTRGY